jgi:geranylgeranyl pyrophosphate synthase
MSGLRQVRSRVRVLQVVLLAEIRCSPEGVLAMGKLVEMINSMSLIVDKVIEEY